MTRTLTTTTTTTTTDKDKNVDQKSSIDSKSSHCILQECKYYSLDVLFNQTCSIQMITEKMDNGKNKVLKSNDIQLHPGG